MILEFASCYIPFHSAIFCRSCRHIILTLPVGFYILPLHLLLVIYILPDSVELYLQLPVARCQLNLLASCQILSILHLYIFIILYNLPASFESASSASC